MDFLNAALRVVHIVSVVVWIGSGLSMAAFVVPAAKGEAGMRFLKNLYTKTPLGIVFAVASLLTTLCGVLLYITGSSSHFSQTGNIVLGIGAVAGLATFGHGASTLGPLTNKIAAALTAGLPESGTANLSEAEALVAKYERNARISLMMGLVALVFMASARYLA